jgi:23S rRNA (cytosine1962-C5)-methyltransferase
MVILETSGWKDYELIDSGDGKRLERFGAYTLVRPDPQAIWKPLAEESVWDKADAVFDKNWINKTQVPEKWQVKYKNLSLYLRLTPFKHTGMFPEQQINWEFIEKKIKDSKREINILNLFGYTGISTLVAAEAGAKVTHVDASKPSITWLRENQEASGLMSKPVRIIVDDVLKFTTREIKRGVKYDAVLMDPPVYGHDPKGRIWEFNKDFPKLMENVSQVLSNDPLFVIVNTYAISSSSIMLENVMKDYLGKFGGNIQIGELALKEKTGGRLLSTGIFGRWEK